MIEEEKKREEAIANAEKALGEPVLAEMPEELRRTKRNMLALSAAMIFAFFSNLPLDLSTLPGIGEDAAHHAKWVWAGALLVLLYLTAQFVWLMYDYSMEARLRVTGSRMQRRAEVSLGAHINDFSDHVRQSTLYGWYISNKEYLDRTTETFEKWGAVFDDLSVGNAEGKKDAFLMQVKDFEGLFGSNLFLFRQSFIQSSLARFDHLFWRFFYSQRRRILLFDILLPGILAVGALGVGGLGLWDAYTSDNIAATINLLSSF